MYPHSNNTRKYPLEGSLHSTTEITPSFTKIIMAEAKKKLWKVMNRLVKLQRREEEGRDKEEIQYHGPYTDASGQRFFLPQKLINNRVQGVEYDFSEDLDGDKLMNNLSWLGRGGDIMDLAARQQEEEEEDDEESSYPPRKKKKVIIGGGGGGGGGGGDEEFLSERSLRKALPEISQTLSNWTVHGQNLGHMVDEYKRKSRTMPVKKRLQIGNFFNTASNVLDTIESMTENTILNSVQFVKGGGGLRGGSSIERTGSDMSNPPPIHLAPTPLNMTCYSARYEDPDRNVVIPPETYSKWMYSGNFPVYPTGIQLRHNLNKENVDFAYDSDAAGNTSEDDQSENEDLRDSSGEGTASDSDGSYV